MTTVRAATYELLRAHGIDTVFGNPGSTELPMLDQFPDDFRYVLGLQEAVVVGMADGYAQLTGRPAMVNLHTGPGVGNAMGAILTAQANRTPMLVTAGQQVRAMMPIEALLTHVDPTVLPRPAVKWAYEPARAQDVPAAVSRALQLAKAAPTGPVFLSLPMDDFTVELDDREVAQAGGLGTRRVTHRAVPDPAASAGLARLLAGATSPAMITGAEVDLCGAWDSAVRLAERRALPVWGAPAEGRAGFPEDHPNFQGFLQPAMAVIARTLAPYDLVMVVGAPVFRYYPYVPGPYLPPGCRLVQLTANLDEAARAPVGDAIVADVRHTLDAVLDHLDHLDESGEPCGACSARRRVPPRPAPHPPTTSTAGPMSPATAFAALARAAPPDTLWVNESPSNVPEFQDQIRISAPRSFLFTASGGLGFGLAAAVGAQLAEPDRTVVAVVGDGSMHYAITALWTAATYRVPVLVVVLTNREYAILKWFAQFEQVSSIPGLDLPGIDICSVAAGYGVPARRVDSAGELTEAVRAATTGRAAEAGPTLIEVPVCPSLPALTRTP